MNLVIDTENGQFYLVDRYDIVTGIGCVCAYDRDGRFVGSLDGKISDYSDVELEKLINGWFDD